MDKSLFYILFDELIDKTSKIEDNLILKNIIK